MDFSSLPPGARGFALAQAQAKASRSNDINALASMMAIESELELAPLKRAQLQASLDKARRQERAMAGFAQAMQTGGQNALAQGAAVGDIGPTVTNAQRQGQSIPDEAYLNMLTADVNPRTVNAMRDITNPQMQVHKGYAYDPRRTPQGFMPGMDVSQSGQASMVTIGPDGMPRISAPQGAMETYGGFQRVGEAAKADFDPFLGQVDEQGRPIPQTRGAFARQFGPQPPQVAPAPIRTTAPTDQQAIRMVAEAGDQPISVNVPGAPRVPGAGMGLSASEQEAAKVKAKAQAENEVNKPQATIALQTAVNTLDRLAAEASAVLTSPGVGKITGVVGKFPDIPGGKAADTRARMETLKAQIGFNVLQAMRDASKTGGALGNVSEKELFSLQNALGSLETSQSEEQFKRSLRQIIDYTQGAKQRLNQAFQSTYQGQQQAPRAPADVLRAADLILGVGSGDR